CMLTSRLRQATGAVQTFFQRVLMNLEKDVPSRVIDTADWKTLKNYRVWEAARRVFLYPEAYIEPELRDDKSPLFQALERTILEQEIKDDNVEGAFADYLQGLDEIARLDVRGVWFQPRESTGVPGRASVALRPAAATDRWEQGTFHVFARTFGAPYVWYYRRLEHGRVWTPWEKVDLDVESEHLVPIIFERRLHLFWTEFREAHTELPKLDRDNKNPPPKVGKDWEVHLAYSFYDRGRWSRKRLSAGGIIDRLGGHRGEGSARLARTDYTLRAETPPGASGLPQMRVHLYRRTLESALAVVHLGRFDLDGCHGELRPDRPQMYTQDLSVLPPVVRPALLATAVAQQARPFTVGSGGTLRGPAGYRLHGMGFAPAGHASPPLSLPTGDSRVHAVALRQAHGGTLLPVLTNDGPAQDALVPFFFQDRFRTYFVRPFDGGVTTTPLVARPLGPVRTLPISSRTFRRAAPPARRSRGAAARAREDVLEIDDLAAEALDALDDRLDEAWHPDDADEARRPRRPGRTGRTAGAAGTRPSSTRRRQATGRRTAVRLGAVRRTHRDVSLQFSPFEHADTCRLISTFKAKGLDGLLSITSTRPRQGHDHQLAADGTWRRSPDSSFDRRYGAGPLLGSRPRPHLDIAFEAGHPYASYNWELFFHAPLQVATRLAKEGRHEEAQRWFHFIFDPTTDSSAPSPRRYWQFAPFRENDEYQSARDMMHVLSYAGGDSVLIARQAGVLMQMTEWWEKPFSPHVIARLRTAAYQKAVVMKYIDNLIEWGDKLFRRDSMESIQEATQLYILAANILGPRPEKIPAITSRPPLTFAVMRPRLNAFSNLEVKLEHLQVARPFRVAAQPDASGARNAIGLATQYFCTPPNPQLDKYWDTVADRLFKIRNCMNIQGVVRQLALFEPPIDPGLLVRAAAAGVDLGSVIASLNAPPPHYRFRFLLARALRMAEEIRSFAALVLTALERKDAEALAALRASGETALLDAVRDIGKKHVREVEEELGGLGAKLEQVETQIRHLETLTATLMNPQEDSQQKSLTAAQVMSGVAEGIDLVAKVLHAIPEFQTGAAGGFSSPFVTLQLGGQMFGDIAGAFAASVEKVMTKHETEADMAGVQAEYQRRREEWQHELEVLAKEKAQVNKHLAETRVKHDIVVAELRRQELALEQARKVSAFMREKYTSEQLYGWMLGQISGTYFQAYKLAFDAAQQAERAFRFERGDASSSFIEFSYWDSLKKGLLAGERLLVDLRRLEAAQLDGDRRGLEITRHLSLRADFPVALAELLETGACEIDVTEALLDGDFPGHYVRRIKTVASRAPFASVTFEPFDEALLDDDLTPTAPSCYGNTVCKTPNIDRIAERGMRFTRAYCQGTYCGPSRASFMSGYYPHATGVQGYTNPRPVIGDRATWSQHFKNAGYYSARVSKIFHM
ncbi:MAG: neuraminidase-like domain-containing protein, partial [Vicinamibacterales bacterium]